MGHAGFISSTVRQAAGAAILHLRMIPELSTYQRLGANTVSLNPKPKLKP